MPSQNATMAAPTPGAARMHSEAHGADVQDLVRVRRQQRDDAAEQHGEQIERDRAEHRLLLPDEHEAAEDIAPVPLGDGLARAPASRPAS